MTDTTFSEYAPITLPYETSQKLRLLSQAAGMGPSEYLNYQLSSELRVPAQSSDLSSQSSYSD